MADINIADPGSNKAPLQAAFQNLLGYGLISSGNISSPVEFLDVTLPDGYISFIFKFFSVNLDTSDGIMAAFSYDGGLTFLNDNFDSYQMHALSSEHSATLADHVIVDGLAFLVYVAQDITSKQLMELAVEIAPGSSSEFSHFSGVSSSGISSGYASLGLFRADVNPAATITPTAARANLVRFLPYGNGDCNPPTSGENIIAGSWALFGILNP